MEEAVKQLTPLPFTGSDLPYTMVWLNGDACHAPLLKEGHLSIQVAGSTCSATCIRVSQQLVCQLLSSGSQVVYPTEINGCEVPLIASPPDSMAKKVNLLGGKPIYLKVDILQSNTEVSELKAPPLGSHSSSILIASPVSPPLPKADGEVSMTMEVRELLSWAGLDTSEHASGSFTPKRWEPVVLITPLPTKPEDFPKPVDTSSQVSAPDNAEMEDTSLEEIPAPSHSTAEALGPNGDAPLPDVAHLWEEANRALGDLLAVKSSINACWWKLVLEFSMAIHENDSEAMGSIKVAKVICTCSIEEAKNCCSIAIREPEAQRAKAVSIQQSHHKTVQHLEEESIEEERKSQLNILSACQTALWTSHPEFHSVLAASYHVLLEHAPTLHLFCIPQGAPPFPPGSAPSTSSPPMPEHLPRPKWQYHSRPDGWLAF